MSSSSRPHQGALLVGLSVPGFGMSALAFRLGEGGFISWLLGAIASFLPHRL